MGLGLHDEFSSRYFKVETRQFAGTHEQVVIGGKDKFPAAIEALHNAGIKNIVVVGYRSQGPAHANNGRRSLDGSGITVRVALRETSTSIPTAEADGFTREEGNLVEVHDGISSADLVVLLISDSSQVGNFKDILASMKPGATLLFAHGFLLGHMKNIGAEFPFNINVVAVCPKGMGPSVRRLYNQGSGINASFAVEKDVDGCAVDIALAWAILIGSPFVFKTTLEMEYRSDLFGERSILLGAVHGACEALFLYFSNVLKVNPDLAYIRSVENITGPIRLIISREGLLGVNQKMVSQGDGDLFARIFFLAFHGSESLLNEIYEEVQSGNEIRSVVMVGEVDKQIADTADMWKVGEGVRATRASRPSIRDQDVDPITAGIYLGIMMAQIVVLLNQGHSWTEICNESIIEAVDSLLPYMHHKGLAYMVGNCSTTAYVGNWKWAPRWEYLLRYQVLSDHALSSIDDDRARCFLSEFFLGHSVHEALQACSAMRPDIDIVFS